MVLKINLLFKAPHANTLENQSIPNLTQLQECVNFHLASINGAAVLIFQGYDGQLDKVVHTIYPAYLPYVAERVVKEVYKPPQVPASFHDINDLALIHRFIGRSREIQGKMSRAEANSDVSTEKLCFDPPLSIPKTTVGIWFCPSRKYPDQAPACHQPIIILFKGYYHLCNDLSVQLQHHYSKNMELFRALEYSPAGIFLTLHELFDDWNFITTKLLERCESEEMLCLKGQPFRVVDRVPLHHQDLKELPKLQEYLKQHQTAVQRLIQFYYVDVNKKTDMHNRPNQVKHQLYNHLMDLKDELDNWSTRVDQIVQRYQNLIDLDFDVASARMNRSMTILTALAFVFVPLGFLASIFGMADIDSKLEWYGISSAGTLIISLIIWYCNRLPGTSRANLALRNVRRKHEPGNITHQNILTSIVESPKAEV